MYPHHLEIGGSQTNALDWATALRDHFGHEVVFCATGGPAAALVRARGFRLLELPRPKHSPSVTLTRQVLGIARAERPDVVHALEWPQILDAYYGAHLRGRFPLLGTVLTMAVQRMVPRTIPVTYGSEQMVADARLRQRGPVWLTEPPVDTVANAPGAADGPRFRDEHGIGPDTHLIVVVSRLISWLKAEGLFRAVDAVGELAADADVRLVVVGGGPVADALGRRAEECNRRAGRTVVTLTGPLADPRPAYDAADVVLGMGGSMLRGMAFAKAGVVLGEKGYSEVLGPGTVGLFLREGFYGIGSGVPSDLTGQIRSLLADPRRRAELARFARSVVVDRYGLEQSAGRLAAMYRQVATMEPRVPAQIGDGAATLLWRTSSVISPLVRERWRATAGRVRS